MRSMTGFGLARQETETAWVAVEVKTVNHRHLKLQPRVSEVLSPWTQEIEQLVKGRFTRGAVLLGITYRSLVQSPAYQVNQQTLESYLDELRRLADRLGTEQLPAPVHLLQLPGVIEEQADREQVEADAWKLVRQALNEALDRAVETREREGATIREDLTRRLQRLQQLSQQVTAALPQVNRSYRDRLLGRVKDLLSGTEVDVVPEDLVREVSIHAERGDIAEELQRLQSHIGAMQAALEQEKPVGRRLEFLGQEMLRETNTMASKTQDQELIQVVLEAKLEVDKIREQALNVE